VAERSERDYPLSHESWERSRALYGEDHLLEQDVLRALDPDFADLYLRFSHEHLNARSVLSQRTRELCAISALTLIEKPRQLGAHVKAAIRAGASREEALEAILQMVVYAGLPTVVEAVHVYNRAIAELAEAEPESAAARSPRPARFADDALTFHERSLPTKARL
jgi:4-carboxymuconolactone decarboxylase